jgi:hypothetical protein
MKKAFLGSLARLGLGVVLLSVGVGCEAQECDDTTASGGSGGADAGTEESNDGTCVQLKSLKRFRGANPIEGQAEWVPGAPITIDGRNGDIEVVQGADNVVRARFIPVVLLAYDSSNERVNGQFDLLDAVAMGNAGGVTGAVLVKTSRKSGAASSLGADIRVEIPPGFDGALTVLQDNGQTDIDFAGNATSVKLNSGNGSCSVTSSAVATSVDLFCDNGDLSANISGAPAGTGTRSIHTDLGDINLSFVGTIQPFNVQALARGGVVNTVNDVAAGCTVQVAGPNSKTVSCNGGTSADPVFQVNADSLSDITLTF